MRVTEGGVTVEVPEQPEAGVGEGVFYNPDQERNRDLTVAILRAARSRLDRTDTYLDATAASGIRGVRAAADGWAVTCCDVDPEAADLCRANLARNDLEGTVRREDANLRLHRERFDVVDLDPFGTPTPFVDSAVRSARQLLCVTATDTAPLCGAHFDSGVRHYGAVPRNTEYHAEMGVRVLVSAVVRAGARHDVALRPVLTHATDHYVRTYLIVDGGASVANDRIDALGHVHHCQHCLWRTHTHGLLADPPDACPHCGHHLQTAGPIWLDPVVEGSFLSAVADGLDASMGTVEEAADLLERLDGELETPTHYDQHRLTKRWGTSAVAMDEFLDGLRAAGHDASRTHYGGTTFKTDADVAEIEAAILGGGG